MNFPYIAIIIIKNEWVQFSKRNGLCYITLLKGDIIADGNRTELQVVDVSIMSYVDVVAGNIAVLVRPYVECQMGIVKEVDNGCTVLSS